MSLVVSKSKNHRRFFMFSNIIDLANRTVALIRHQGYDEASKKIKLLTSLISSSDELSASLTDPNEEFYSIFSSMTDSLAKSDYILFADILEESFIPYVKSLISYPDSLIIGNYSIEPSSSGFLTAKHIPSNIYMHSNCNPMDEARELINFYFDEEKTSYVVYGLGLGYHVVALNEACLGAMNINVYESDSELIDFVKNNDALNIFEKKNIKIIHDPIGSFFLDNLSKENTGLLFHYPSVLKISNNDLKIQIKRFYANWNSYFQWKTMIRINFNKNVMNCKQNIATEKEKFANKNVYIVAGGPSVDHCIEHLKTLDKKENIILCVTTVLKKLLNEGVVPDYAVVMDAQERTYGHMTGIEDCQVPLIINPAAYWEFSENHKGPKYLALQKGYAPSELIAAENNYPLFDTSGTVTTLALDIAIKFGAKNIFFVGVDMAFPGGKTHASGTMDEKKTDTSKMIPIKDVNGNTVYTDELFLAYLKAIEEKIQENPQIKYYNLSPFGAEIKGTSLYSI